ncbi:MAG: signal peptidase II [Candidatus Limnocylindrales bacterium]
MTMAAQPDDPDLEEIVDEDEDEEEGAKPSGNRAEHATDWGGPSKRRWLLFIAIAVAVVAADQTTKAWITSSIGQPGSSFSVLGNWLNFVYGQNSGILFGMVPQSATAFAIVSLVVIVLIVVYHQRAGRGVVMSIATSLLLGGAIGNLIDRLHYGAVVDWIDMGIGTWRFWTYNIADAAITTSLILVFVAAMFPVVAEWGTDD